MVIRVVGPTSGAEDDVKRQRRVEEDVVRYRGPVDGVRDGLPKLSAGERLLRLVKGDVVPYVRGAFSVTQRGIALHTRHVFGRYIDLHPQIDRIKLAGPQGR